MSNIQERVSAGAIPFQPDPQQDMLGVASFPESGFASPPTRDAIRRTGPQYSLAGANSGTPFDATSSGLSGIVSSLLGVVQQLLSLLGLGTQTTSPQTFFTNAEASSTGDPHLAFSGTGADGATQQVHFDSMTGHADLMDSDSFAGGYRISTGVTQPGAGGVTYNSSASVFTDFNQVQVSLDKNGNAAIAQGGQTFSLANGQSYDLGGGELVSRTAAGAVIVRENNGAGGTITTTLSRNAAGVDVSAQAANVDLSGDLLNQLPTVPQPRLMY